MLGVEGVRMRTTRAVIGVELGFWSESWIFFSGSKSTKKIIFGKTKNQIGSSEVVRR